MKTLALASSLLAALGCGSDDKDAPAAVDAGASADAEVEGIPTCPGLLASYDLSAASFAGYARPRDAGDPESPTVYGLTTLLDAGPPTDLFEIQFWSGFGAFSTEVSPGVFPIQGAETDLIDCGLCALVFGDLAANGSTDTVLVAQSGSITIDEITLEAGATVRGGASALQYRQVNSGGVIPDGCGLTITNISFDLTLDAP